MSVTLIVPVDFGADPERQVAWDWLRIRYPLEWQLVEAWSPRRSCDEWSKGDAVNGAVEHAAGDKLVIADADLYIDIDVLRHALDLLDAEAPWVMPHGIVYRLARKSSATVIAMQDPPAAQRIVARRHEGPIGGGFVVCTREAFDTVHGIDPRFTGWGGEDISFGRALDTLVGSHARLWAPTWHLWHTPLERHDGRRASPDNERLAARYLDAVGQPVAMRALCEEH